MDHEAHVFLVGPMKMDSHWGFETFMRFWAWLRLTHIWKRGKSFESPDFLWVWVAAYTHLEAHVGLKSIAQPLVAFHEGLSHAGDSRLI